VNALTRGSLNTLAVALMFVGAGQVDESTGIAERVAPSEAHAFGWLCIIVVCTMIVRSYARSGARLPNLREMAMPRQRRAYGKRVRRYV